MTYEQGKPQQGRGRKTESTHQPHHHMMIAHMVQQHSVPPPPRAHTDCHHPCGNHTVRPGYVSRTWEVGKRGVGRLVTRQGKGGYGRVEHEVYYRGSRSGGGRVREGRERGEGGVFMPSPLPLVSPPWQQSYRSYSGILPMNTNMNKEIIGEIHKSTIPRNASFSGNKQNTGPNESSRNPPPPSRVHPPSVPGLFAKTFPLPCLPACLSLLPPRVRLWVHSRPAASTVTYQPAPLPDEGREYVCGYLEPTPHPK